MSVSKYVSEIRIIPHPVEVIFNYLSDFENLRNYVSEDILASVSEKVPGLSIRNFESDRDSCRFEAGNFGSAEIRITDRTPFSTIKIEGRGAIPIELKFWIQLLPLETYKTKLRLTLHAEMGMMIKMLAGNKLQEGIDKLAEALSLLPYHSSGL